MIVTISDGLANCRERRRMRKRWQPSRSARRVPCARPPPATGSKEITRGLAAQVGNRFLQFRQQGAAGENCLVLRSPRSDAATPAAISACPAGRQSCPRDKFPDMPLPIRGGSRTEWPRESGRRMPMDVSADGDGSGLAVGFAIGNCSVARGVFSAGTRCGRGTGARSLRTSH